MTPDETRMIITSLRTSDDERTLTSRFLAWSLVAGGVFFTSAFLAALALAWVIASLN